MDCIKSEAYGVSAERCGCPKCAAPQSDLNALIAEAEKLAVTGPFDQLVIRNPELHGFLGKLRACVRRGARPQSDQPAQGEAQRVYRCAFGHTFVALAHSALDGPPHHCPECGNTDVSDRPRQLQDSGELCGYAGSANIETTNEAASTAKAASHSDTEASKPRPTTQPRACLKRSDFSSPEAWMTYLDSVINAPEPNVIVQSDGTCMAAPASQPAQGEHKLATEILRVEKYRAKYPITNVDGWGVLVKMADEELAAPASQPDLRMLCAEMYQVAGVLGAPEQVLDNLSAAAAGKPLPHKTLLPFHVPASQPAAPAKDGSISHIGEGHNSLPILDRFNPDPLSAALLESFRAETLEQAAQLVSDTPRTPALTGAMDSLTDKIRNLGSDPNWLARQIAEAKIAEASELHEEFCGCKPFHHAQGTVYCKMCSHIAALSATKLESGEPQQQPEVNP